MLKVISLIMLLIQPFPLSASPSEQDAIIGVDSKVIELYANVEDDDPALKIKRRKFSKAFVELGIQNEDGDSIMGLPILEKNIENAMVKISYQDKTYWVEEIFVHRLDRPKVTCPKGVLAKALVSQDGVSVGFGGSCKKATE